MQLMKISLPVWHKSPTSKIENYAGMTIQTWHVLYNRLGFVQSEE